jgi:2-C-methyl-D-erythritol 4-phosphate cytidylyltransferase
LFTLFGNGFSKCIFAAKKSMIQYEMKMRTSAIILAGGAGTRLKSEISKQFINICGKTVMEHTIDVFEHHAQIDEIALVINLQNITEMEEIVQKNGYRKVKKIVQGGAERQDSAWAAIQTYNELPNANLLIHDAVRPLIDPDMISEVIHRLENYNAVTVAIPTTDTIYEVENDHIHQIPKRKKFMRAQTPQAFKQHMIQKAYQLAFENKDFAATDDCCVVAKYFPNEPIFVVKGSERNIKVTHKEDLYLLEQLLSS